MSGCVSNTAAYTFDLSKNIAGNPPVILQGGAKLNKKPLYWPSGETYPADVH